MLNATKTVDTYINEGPLFPANLSSPGPVSIGAHLQSLSTALTHQFEGLVDDDKYYDRALSEDEIQNTDSCGVPVVRRVLNLDAALFGSPADQDHGLCVWLEAGAYTATLVTSARDPDARLTVRSPGRFCRMSSEARISSLHEDH